jgi:hypothetical protein
MITLRQRRTHETQAIRTRAADFSLQAAVRGKGRNRSRGGRSLNQQIHAGSSHQTEDGFKEPDRLIAGSSQLHDDRDLMMQVDEIQDVDASEFGTHVSAMLFHMSHSLGQMIICAMLS